MEPETSLFARRGGLNVPTGKGARLSARITDTKAVAVELEDTVFDNDFNARIFWKGDMEAVTDEPH
jgi:hypothetical protein